MKLYNLCEIVANKSKAELKFILSQHARYQSTTAVSVQPGDTESVDKKNPITAAFLRLVRNNVIKEDDYQYKIVESLQNLDHELKEYTPTEPSVWTRLFNTQQSAPKPKGLYLWGSVGCGKTFLMDLFYENCSVSNLKKKRVHFHRFMLDVHAEIHQIKTGKIAVSASDQKNPIPTVAKLIASRSWLLCLDEFQVTDVADAMILKQLFTHLFEDGIVLIATSNREPDELYRSGLQRSAFLPFIPLLKHHCDVKCLDSHIDYRKREAAIKNVYFIGEEKSAINATIDTLFKVLSLSEDDIVGPKTFMVNNRRVRLNKTCGRIADCDFEELCAQPLGPDDYDRIGRLFHTVIIRNIPQMTIKMKSEVRRFITLIDMMYDNRVRVVFSAQKPLNQLFKFESNSDEDDDDHNSADRIVLDDLNLDAHGDGSNLSFITGEDEIFAVDRTISRIIEMQTKQYWDSIPAPN